MDPTAGLPHPRGSRAAAILGIALTALGIALAIASLFMAFSTLKVQWLLVLLPALGLIKLGSMIYASRFESAVGPRSISDAIVRRSMVQDFAHHNKAWDNVSRWESKYGHGESKAEGTIGKPQRKLESWALRLKR